ncbi:MAG TPA: DUF6662 family protein [Candidatus Limnocylindria bacterium]|nr:DUF6662 family protein [Candidatus Limnocylindria bacterium]
MRKSISVMVGALAAFATVSRADENLFGYTYLSDTLPKGKWEVEQWTTGRIGKESGRFLGMDFRTEIETGLTDRLQASLYLNSNYFYSKGAQGSSDSFADKNYFGVSGTSAEFKYQILSPVKDFIGLALYLEPGYGTIESSSGAKHHEYELESKIILEKHWLEDALIGTFNFTFEPEFQKGDGDTGYHTNLKMEWGTGLAYRVVTHWYAGFETRTQTEFADANLDASQFVAVFAGPAIHYGAQRWWATLTVLPQVWGWPDTTGTGGLHLDDHERLEVRLKAGFNL